MRCMPLLDAMEVMQEAVLKILGVVLYMLEVIDGGRYVLRVLGLMICMLLRVLEILEDELCWLVELE